MLHIQKILHFSAYRKKPVRGSPFYSISRTARLQIPTALLHKEDMVASAGAVVF